MRKLHSKHWVLWEADLETKNNRRMLIKKHLWEQTYEKGEEWSRFGQREKLNCEVYCQPSPTPQVILELEWSFRNVLSWTKMARPLYSHSNQSLTMDHPGKGSSQAGSLQLRQFLKGFIAVGCLHIAFPAVG